MGEVNKRPQVIRDLIELATFIAEDNLDAPDRFLAAAEATFFQPAKMPGMGKLSQLSYLNLADVRQQSIKGFRKYNVRTQTQPLLL
jgi:toxin ParE1/3/4